MLTLVAQHNFDPQPPVPLGTAALLLRFEDPQLRASEPPAHFDSHVATPRVWPLTSRLHFL